VLNFFKNQKDTPIDGTKVTRSSILQFIGTKNVRNITHTSDFNIHGGQQRINERFLLWKLGRMLVLIVQQNCDIIDQMSVQILLLYRNQMVPNQRAAAAIKLPLHRVISVRPNPMTFVSFDRQHRANSGWENSVSLVLIECVDLQQFILQADAKIQIFIRSVRHIISITDNFISDQPFQSFPCDCVAETSHVVLKRGC
jgi:hypothetical protein